MDKDPCAAGRFYRAVRDFAENARPWHSGVIWYETRPDETWDLTLVSERAYGRRDEYLAVMAAAGIDMVDQLLPQKKIALPGEQQLYAIKRRCGFESRGDYREGKAPTWL